MDEQVAVIRNVQIGLRHGHLCLSFRTFISPDHSALQEVLNPDVITDYVRAYMVSEVKQLEGKPIWVKVDSSTITVTRFCTPEAWGGGEVDA